MSEIRKELGQNIESTNSNSVLQESHMASTQAADSTCDKVPKENTGPPHSLKTQKLDKSDRRRMSRREIGLHVRETILNEEGNGSKTKKGHKSIIHSDFSASFVDPLDSWQRKKKVLKKTLQSSQLEIYLAFLLLLALFLGDLSVLILPPHLHLTIEILLVVVMLVFITEIILRSLIFGREYVFTFFFWADLIGTVSMIADFEVISYIIRSQNESNSVSNSSIDAAINNGEYSHFDTGVLIRTSARTTRAIRILRLIKFARFLRWFKFLKFFKKYYNKKVFNIEEDEQEAAVRLGMKLGMLLVKRNVIMIAILILMVPQLEVQKSESTMTHILDLAEIVCGNFTIYDNIVFFESLQQMKLSSIDDSIVDVFNLTLTSNPNIVKLSINNIRLSLSTLEEIDIYKWFLSGSYSSSSSSYAFVNDYELRRLQAGYNILLGCMLLALLASTNYFFTRDVNEAVVLPLVRTTKAVKRLAQTLFILSQDDDANTEEDAVLKDTFIDSVVDQLTVFFNGNDSKPQKKKSLRSSIKIDPTNIVLTSRDKSCDESPRKYISDERVKCLTSIEECLKDGQAVNFFKVFLTSEFAVESLIFLQKVDTYTNTWIDLQKNLKHVLVEFVSESAPSQVNLSSIQREELMDSNINILTRYVFEKARLEIVNQLERDNFRRFKNSELGMQLVHLKKKELKEYQLVKKSSD